MPLSKINLIANDAVNTAQIADDAITSSTIADDAVVAAAIANDAVVEAAIADDAVTQAKMNALGSSLYSWDASAASATGTGWRTMSSTMTLPDDATLASSWANMMSVTFKGYISGGTWYWTWRIYDVTDNSVVQPISGPSSQHWYGGGSGTGGFRFRGYVHGYSHQPARVFDVTGRGGNGMTLEMRPSNGSGDVPQTNSSQTLYADQIFWYSGAMTGMHLEDGYT